MTKSFVDELIHEMRPDGPAARLGVLLGTIERAREALYAAQRKGCSPFVFAGIASDEITKVIAAKDAYDLAAGIQ